MNLYFPLPKYKIMRKENFNFILPSRDDCGKFRAEQAECSSSVVLFLRNFSAFLCKFSFPLPIVQEEMYMWFQICPP